MALITAAEARTFIKALGSATDQDTLLDTLIARADRVLARRLGWPADNANDVYSLEQQTYTLFFDGPDADASDRLTLPLRNVTSVTSLHYDPDRDYGAADLLTEGTDFETDQHRGTLFLLPDATLTWGTSRRSIKFVGVAGWSTAPEDLKEATGLLVAHWFDLGGTRRGVQSLSKTGDSVTYRDETIPASVLQLVQGYRVGGWLG